MDKCLKGLSECLKEQIYDMFFYCEIADSFIDAYEANEQWDEMVSTFLIDYLKLLSSMPIK
jgi:hypothetical protein